MKRTLISIAALLITLFSAPAHAVVAKSVTFQAEVWADNWFALYVNGKKVGEDSIPILLKNLSIARRSNSPLPTH